MEDCDFAKILNSDCHKITYNRKKFIHKFSILPTDEQELYCGVLNYVVTRVN